MARLNPLTLFPTDYGPALDSTRILENVGVHYQAAQKNWRYGPERACQTAGRTENRRKPPLLTMNIKSTGKSRVKYERRYTTRKIADRAGASATGPRAVLHRFRPDGGDGVEIFGQNGGYIAAPAHAIQVGTPPENVMAMLGAVLGPDALQHALEQARL